MTISIDQDLDDKFRLSRIQTDVGLTLLRLIKPTAMIRAFEASLDLKMILAFKRDGWV